MKSQNTNDKLQTHFNSQGTRLSVEGGKPYDLEDLTFLFAQRVRAFVKRLPRTVCNADDVRQVARASGSIGANYIEANESLGKKDFRMHVRIARKEAKEARYWLRLLDTQDDQTLNMERDSLIDESGELLKILSAILEKTKNGRD